MIVPSDLLFLEDWCNRNMGVVFGLNYFGKFQQMVDHAPIIKTQTKAVKGHYHKIKIKIVGENEIIYSWEIACPECLFVLCGYCQHAFCFPIQDNINICAKAESQNFMQKCLQALSVGHKCASDKIVAQIEYIKHPYSIIFPSFCYDGREFWN